MIANPYKYQSDSFYFVGDKMIMHNKAEYEILREDADSRAQAKGGFDDSDDEDFKGSKGGGAKAGSKGSKMDFDSDEDGRKILLGGGGGGGGGVVIVGLRERVTFHSCFSLESEQVEVHLFVVSCMSSLDSFCTTLTLLLP
jgi:hypothetical protein